MRERVLKAKCSALESAYGTEEVAASMITVRVGGVAPGVRCYVVDYVVDGVGGILRRIDEWSLQPNNPPVTGLP
jgi:hypothetical protein